MLADLQRRLVAAEASTAEAFAERDELQALLKARASSPLRERTSHFSTACRAASRRPSMMQRMPDLPTGSKGCSRIAVRVTHAAQGMEAAMRQATEERLEAMALQEGLQSELRLCRCSCSAR